MKKFIAFFVILSCLLMGPYSFAQNSDSLRLRYKKENIVRFGNDFLKNGERIKFSDLAYEFKQAPVAADLYQAAHTNKKISTFLRYGALLANIAVVSFAAQNNRKPALLSLGAEFALLITAAQLQKRSVEQTDRALILRNTALFQ